tara:strand:+ start:4226 stop:6250 length:2025 start_codon:yes stop_codon:yes gene_type:complete
MKLTVEQAVAKAQKLALIKKTDEAEALLRSVLKITPSHPMAKKQLESLLAAVQLPDADKAQLLKVFNQGHACAAIELAQNLQKKYSRSSVLYLIEGAANAQIGENVLAENAFREALKIDPQSAQGYNNLANSLKEQGRFEQSRQAFLSAIKLNPKFAQAYNNLGVLLKDMKRYPQAIRRLTQAVHADPNYYEAYRNLGLVYQEKGDHALAISMYKEVLKLAPNDLDAMSYLANCQRAQQDFEGAIETLKTLLNLAPQRHEQRQKLAMSLSDIGDYDGAISALETVVDDAPNDLVALINLGNAISKTSDLERAMSVVERVLEIEPNNLGALNNIGVIKQNMGDLDGAAAVFDKALAIDPNVSELKMNRSVVHFLNSEFEQAWPLYYSRFEHENPSTPFLKTIRPVWTGERCRLFVWAEQGIGDEVFFASLLDAVSQQVEQLTVSVDKRLKNMFARSFPNISFILRGADFPSRNYDAHIPIGGLGQVLRNGPQAFDSHPQSFIKVDVDRVAKIKRALGAFDGKTIGISWNTQNRKNNHVRNIDLLMFMQAFQSTERRFVNLQYGDTDAEIENVCAQTGANIITLPDLDRFKDIDGLSAAIMACDCVVTIDNSTVHLAASMGQETHLILPFFPDWRWPFVERGSPWYPNLNIYRQSSRFGWPTVLRSVDNNLKKLGS